jgi:DNA-binding GntR family transcriptional regulator
MPVREAMRHLIAEGALEMLPSRKVQVPIMTMERFHDLTATRLLVEGAAAERAAPRVTKEACSGLRHEFEIMRDAAYRQDYDTFLAANKRFHFLIYACAESPNLMAIIEALWLKAGPFIRLTFHDLAFELSEKNHTAALLAMETRDGAAAGRAIRNDLAEAAAQVNASDFADPDSVDERRYTKGVDRTFRSG